MTTPKRGSTDLSIGCLTKLGRNTHMHKEIKTKNLGVNGLKEFKTNLFSRMAKDLLNQIKNSMSNCVLPVRHKKCVHSYKMLYLPNKLYIYINVNILSVS